MQYAFQACCIIDFPISFLLWFICAENCVILLSFSGLKSAAFFGIRISVASCQSSGVIPRIKGVLASCDMTRPDVVSSDIHLICEKDIPGAELVSSFIFFQPSKYSLSVHSQVQIMLGKLSSWRPAAHRFSKQVCTISPAGVLEFAKKDYFLKHY